MNAGCAMIEMIIGTLFCFYLFRWVNKNKEAMSHDIAPPSRIYNNFTTDHRFMIISRTYERVQNYDLF